MLGAYAAVLLDCFAAQARHTQLRLQSFLSPSKPVTIFNISISAAVETYSLDLPPALYSRHPGDTGGCFAAHPAHKDGVGGVGVATITAPHPEPAAVHLC